jgi:hypothetical protein
MPIPETLGEAQGNLESDEADKTFRPRAAGRIASRGYNTDIGATVAC